MAFLTQAEIDLAAAAGVGFPDLAARGYIPGALPTNTASVNALAIQTALDKARGGIFYHAGPAGVYDIDRTLLVGSKTRVVRAPGVRYRAVTGGPGGLTAFAMVRNRNFDSTMYAVSSIVLTRPYAQDPQLAAPGTLNLALATMTYTAFNPLAAGWTSGMHAQVKGDTNANFNGIWEILGVTANSVTFLVGQNDTVTPGAGPMCSGLADADIEFIGGINDSNFQSGFNSNDTAGALGNYNDHCFVFNRVARLRIKQQQYYSVRKYCVMGANLVDPLVDDMYAETASDGVHFYGPCHAPVVTNVRGDYGDDCVIYQTIDGAVYYNFMPPITEGVETRGGDFTGGGTIRDVKLRRTRTTNAILYPDGGPDLSFKMLGTYLIEDTSVRTPMINGATIGGQSRVSVGGGYVTNRGYLENLIVRNLRGRLAISNFGPTTGGNKNITINSVLVDGMSTDPVLGDNLGMDFSYCTIGRLTYRATKYVGQAQLFKFGSTAFIGKLEIEGDFVYGGSGATTGLTVINSTGATIKTISFRNARAIGPTTYINDNSTFANTPQVSFDDIQADRAIIVSNGQPYNITVNGLRANSGSALFNLYGSTSIPFNINLARVTANIGWQGTASVAAGLMTVTAGSGTISVGMDLAGIGFPAGTMVLSLGTGTGGTGTYNLSTVFDAASATVYGSGGPVTATQTLFSNFNGIIAYNNPDGSAPIDLTKIARTAGNMVKARINTGTGSATDVLANNMAICDATGVTGSWKQMSEPANRVY